MLIKQGERYGAMVGNIRVFTMERAVEVYKMFAARCYADLTMEASVVLSNVGGRYAPPWIYLGRN